MEAGGLNMGRWTMEEDEKLRTYIEKHGIGFWRSVPAKAGLQRSGKGCRLRWTNYLQPDIEQGKFSMAEELTIIQLHVLLGNSGVPLPCLHCNCWWSAIARHLPKRTDNEINNHWNTNLKKRLAKKGIDPVTDKPRGSDDAPGTGGGGGAGGSGGAAMCAHQHGRHPAPHLSSSHHTPQWQRARLEAEARERQASQLRALVPSAASASVFAPPAPPQMPTTRPVASHRVYSPTTSTLSLVSQNATALASVLQEAHSGFAALVARAATQLQPVVPAHEQEARRIKDGQFQQQRWGDHVVVDVADADNAAAAFAGLLVNESEHQEQTEVEKKYWVFIMNLVNTSPSSASSSLQR